MEKIYLMYSFERIKEITDSFLTAYYCGRKIEYRLDESAETSYYDPIHDTIVVSYKAIVTALEPLLDESNKELPFELIRRPFYHEISHAMLTPSDLTDYWSDEINIFEDQRIETILNSHFMQVNFKKLLPLFHKYQKDTTPLGGFYNMVRHGKCEKKGYEEWVAKRDELIKKYAKLVKAG